MKDARASLDTAGAQTLAAAGQHRPDVVLVDVHMPVTDRIEATRRLAAEHPGTAVVVLTTCASPAHGLTGAGRELTSMSFQS